MYQILTKSIAALLISLISLGFCLAQTPFTPTCGTSPQNGNLVRNGSFNEIDFRRTRIVEPADPLTGWGPCHWQRLTPKNVVNHYHSQYLEDGTTGGCTNANICFTTSSVNIPKNPFKIGSTTYSGTMPVSGTPNHDGVIRLLAKWNFGTQFISQNLNYTIASTEHFVSYKFRAFHDHEIWSGSTIVDTFNHFGVKITSGAPTITEIDDKLRIDLTGGVNLVRGTAGVKTVVSRTNWAQHSGKITFSSAVTNPYLTITGFGTPEDMGMQDNFACLLIDDVELFAVPQLITGRLCTANLNMRQILQHDSLPASAYAQYEWFKKNAQDEWVAVAVGYNLKPYLEQENYPDGEYKLIVKFRAYDGFGNYSIEETESEGNLSFSTALALSPLPNFLHLIGNAPRWLSTQSINGNGSNVTWYALDGLNDPNPAIVGTGNSLLLTRTGFYRATISDSGNACGNLFRTNICYVSVLIEDTINSRIGLSGRINASVGLEVVSSLENQVTPASIQLYPNPATENPTISGIANGTVVRVLSVQGKEISRQTLSSGGSLSVNVLPQGMYFVEVQGVRKTFVKQ